LGNILEFKPEPFFHEINGEMKPCTFNEWSIWFQKTDNRTVGKTDLDDTSVSSVAIGTSKACLYETMIFGGVMDGYCQRTKTREECQVQHNLIVKHYAKIAKLTASKASWRRVKKHIISDYFFLFQVAFQPSFYRQKYSA